MTSLFVSILLALGLLFTALFSVQNATLVSLRWLVWQSIPLPLGWVLTLGFALGLVTGAVVWVGRRQWPPWG
ncbi:lipopolysaccharide assembly protein LapA domain-containing protein [Gloeomargarita lithophora]|uniref:lipopolysaccharide assembly protein LapA domain-containing protein n=1 Tax=Gloeomargarita lithophora TaxID=1188228 RepID=UPI0008F8469C|nr:lipopolysaccharide assembly protein LapA domain-containing protein [Gloeomargarita lithophora]